METKKRLLCCDDDPNVLKALEFMFSKWGYEVTTVDSGERAIQLVGEIEFDAVLMDVHMQGLNGIETIQNIRQFSKKQNILILTSAQLSKIYERAYRELQVYDVVQKPIDFSYLKAIVKESIELDD